VKFGSEDLAASISTFTVSERFAQNMYLWTMINKKYFPEHHSSTRCNGDGVCFFGDLIRSIKYYLDYLRAVNG
jgi:hypothetical protein